MIFLFIGFDLLKKIAPEIGKFFLILNNWQFKLMEYVAEEYGWLKNFKEDFLV